MEVLESLSSNSRLYNVILENYPSLLLCRSASDKKLDESSADMTNKSGVTMSMRLQDWSDICNPAPFLVDFLFIIYIYIFILKIYTHSILFYYDFIFALLKRISVMYLMQFVHRSCEYVN